MDISDIKIRKTIAEGRLTSGSQLDQHLHGGDYGLDNRTGDA